MLARYIGVRLPLPILDPMVEMATPPTRQSARWWPTLCIHEEQEESAAVIEHDALISPNGLFWE